MKKTPFQVANVLKKCNTSLMRKNSLAKLVQFHRTIASVENLSPAKFDVPNLYATVKMGLRCHTCNFKPKHPAQIELDHINPEMKYRNRYGAIVHISDMVKGGRYAWATIVAEMYKCRPLCANCHALHTHSVQRG